MIWNIDFGDRDWHPWFAWYPVQLSHAQRGQRAWLQWIEKSTENVQGYHIHKYRFRGVPPLPGDPEAQR